MPIREFRDSGPPIGEADLDALERELDAELPPQYRAFLLGTNGGSPWPEECFRNKSGVGSLVHVFYAVKHEMDSLTLARNWMQLCDRIPPDLRPIACDAGDSQICISVRGKDTGRIFYWNMENEAGPGRKPWRRNIRRIADSLDEFLDLFYDCDPDRHTPAGA